VLQIYPLKKNPKAASRSRGTTSDRGTATQCQQEKAQQIAAADHENYTTGVLTIARGA
jgi:hypothetical protein